MNMKKLQAAFAAIVAHRNQEAAAAEAFIGKADAALSAFIEVISNLAAAPTSENAKAAYTTCQVLSAEDFKHLLASRIYVTDNDNVCYIPLSKFVTVKADKELIDVAKGVTPESLQRFTSSDAENGIYRKQPRAGVYLPEQASKAKLAELAADEANSASDTASPEKRKLTDAEKNQKALLAAIAKIQTLAAAAGMPEIGSNVQAATARLQNHVAKLASQSVGDAELPPLTLPAPESKAA